MAKHDFGILSRVPLPGERYDCYEPEKYACISVEDTMIDRLWDRLERIPCFWHTVDAPGLGLAGCGVTLIPPRSLPALLAAVGEDPALAAWAALLENARAQKKWVIHFGL